MSRFIDADALKKSYGMADKCSDCVTNSRDCQFNFTFTKMDFCGWIDDAPTADVVEVLHGKWEECEIVQEDGDYKIIEEWQSARCSVCGKYHTTPYMYHFDHFNYCPNCGADMRGETDEQIH